MKANMRWGCLSRGHKILSGVCSDPLRTSFGVSTSQSGEDPNMVRQLGEGGHDKIVLIFYIMIVKR